MTIHTALFTVFWSGTASGGGGVSGSATYQAISDSTSHTYRFFSLGSSFHLELGTTTTYVEPNKTVGRFVLISQDTVL